MGKKLYCGNLAYETTEATLSELFGTIGEVVSVNLITDRMTGRSKGFAFVEMAEDDAARRAISELNGKQVNGREINVAEARPPQQRRGERPGGDARRKRW